LFDVVIPLVFSCLLDIVALFVAPSLVAPCLFYIAIPLVASCLFEITALFATPCLTLLFLLLFLACSMLLFFTCLTLLLLPYLTLLFLLLLCVQCCCSSRNIENENLR
jgi:hypothetical protein